MLMATDTGHRVDEVAHAVFEIVTHVSLATQPEARRCVDLKQLEYLTLALLHTHGKMIVGEIQRRLGVLPAQMSRIIRALENRTPPLIACQINPKDKRKIDVSLTDAGERALLEHQETRIQKLASCLESLSPNNREELAKLLQRVKELLEAAVAEW